MSAKNQLLIVDDDPLIQDALESFFADEFSVVVAAHVEEVKSVLKQLAAPPDFALVDLGLPPTPHRPTEGFAVISVLRAASPDCAIVVVSGQDARRYGQRARALGAADYAEKPCEPQTLKKMLYRARQTTAAASQQLGLIGDSAPIQALRERIRLIAPVSYPVLIVGESGAGKENVARALHTAARDNKPFLAVNCAAIPEHLVEPTLFGNAKGAFTGAATETAGYLGDTDDGTLLLDEIGDLPDATQAKLLRVLESGDYRRVGETRVRQCAARIIAVSNHARQRISEGGRVRDDLYYRIGAFTITVPPLRHLGDDRLLLLEYYLDAIAADLSTPPFTLSAEARQLWTAYHFPGNVRELKNITARLQVKYPGQAVDESALREELCTDDADLSQLQLGQTGSEVNDIAIRLGYEYAKIALADCAGDANAAAQRLKIAPEALRLLLIDD